MHLGTSAEMRAFDRFHREINAAHDPSTLIGRYAELVRQDALWPDAGVVTAHREFAHNLARKIP